MKRRDDIRIDFSAGSDRFREALRADLMQMLDQQTDQKEDIPMKRTMKYSARVALVAALAVVLVSASAFAVMNSVKLGPFATYTQMGDPAQHLADLAAKINAHRADWEGKLYDKQGNLIDDLADHLIEGGGGVFDADGNELQIGWANDKMVLSPRTYDEYDSSVTKFATLAQVQPFMAFDVKLPTALPAGYALDHFEMYSEKPEPNSLYLTAVFAKSGVKGSELNLMLRLMNEESAFETSTGGELRYIKVAGRDAVVDGNCLSVLMDDVLYEYLAMESGVPLDDLIRMAESVR